MLRGLKQRKRQEGFTIIEVLIVLAIAGLIMVVVFLAVPNLQRSQRNNARKSDANNMLQNLSEYIGNANGSLPTAPCASRTACGWISYNPAQLTGVQYLCTSATNVASCRSTIPTHGAVASNTSNAYLIGGAVCNGVNATATGASARDYVIYYAVEGSTGTVCTQGS